MNLNERIKNVSPREIYIASGVVGGLLLAWGVGTTVTLVKEKNQKDKMEIEWKDSDKKRVDEYNLLLEKHNKLTDSYIDTKDALNNNITDLNKENLSLNRNLGRVNEQYASKVAEYEMALNVIDSLQSVIYSNGQEKVALDALLNENNIKIGTLEKELSEIQRTLNEERQLSTAQLDTINTLQEYLTRYIIVKTPIRERHAGKIYLPEGWRLIPKDVETIREAKKLNKDYKNQ
jgi:chromosome segregation ATPase